ncbi:phospholipase D family protein [Sphaerotilus sp.]|uniref:phospholipase D family nuclease n=1 Tax=Sphaerotilus sp. TaxID=2093942 RepID=UPI0034E28BCB
MSRPVSFPRRLSALLSTACLTALLAHGVQARTAAAAAAGYATFAPGASYALCFVPDGVPCETLLVDTINATQRSLRIQAYSFTSVPIAQAVKHARDRGVDVQVIVDKSQVGERYTSATFLKNSGIPVVVDTRPAIAHNKVMIFDGRAVFTGSFNFTKSAQERNAENGLLVRDDPALVKAYADNWLNRFNLSTPY